METDDSPPTVHVEPVEAEPPSDNGEYGAFSETLIDDAPIDPFGGMERLDGFDDCIAGIVDNFLSSTRVCYDTTKLRQQLVEQDGLSLKEAHEEVFQWMCAYNKEEDYNMNSPCFISYNVPLPNRNIEGG